MWCGMVMAWRERSRPGRPCLVSRAKIRDRRGGRWRAYPFQFGDPAAAGAADQKSVCAVAGALLRGISTGHFQEALMASLGKDAPKLSPAVISRLTAERQGEYERWRRRDLPAKRVCVGRRHLPAGPHGRPRRVHAGADRPDTRRQEGTDRLPGLRAGERAELARTPDRSQASRCWVHKTVNILDKIPLSVQATMKKDLRDLLGAEASVRRSDDRRLRREKPRQVRPRGRMSARMAMHC